MRRAIIAVLLCAVPLPAGASQQPSVPSAPVILIEREQYLPSGTITYYRAMDASVLWVQEVRQGDVIEVVNLEPAFPTYQHTVTACASPCRTLPPNQEPTDRLGPDGEVLFDTGVIGHSGDRKSLPTAQLEPDLYEYYCTLHIWMRGAFRVS